MVTVHLIYRLSGFIFVWIIFKTRACTRWSRCSQLSSDVDIEFKQINNLSLFFSSEVFPQVPAHIIHSTECANMGNITNKSVRGSYKCEYVHEEPHEMKDLLIRLGHFRYFIQWVLEVRLKGPLSKTMQLSLNRHRVLCRVTNLRYLTFRFLSRHDQDNFRSATLHQHCLATQLRWIGALMKHWKLLSCKEYEGRLKI
jgi:hypothetical protein